MNEFNNVSVVKNANVYFDGGVTSRTIKFANGETMDIQQGDVLVMLPDDDTWRHFSAGESFEVKANATFQIKVNAITDYCCSFID